MQLEEFKKRIAWGTFVFAEQLPDSHEVELSTSHQDRERLTCNDVLKKFIAHCDTRVAMDDISHFHDGGLYEDLRFGVVTGVVTEDR